MPTAETTQEQKCYLKRNSGGKGKSVKRNEEKPWTNGITLPLWQEFREGKEGKGNLARWVKCWLGKCEHRFGSQAPTWKSAHGNLCLWSQATGGRGRRILVAGRAFWPDSLANWWAPSEVRWRAMERDIWHLWPLHVHLQTYVHMHTHAYNTERLAEYSLNLGKDGRMCRKLKVLQWQDYTDIITNLSKLRDNVRILKVTGGEVYRQGNLRHTCSRFLNRHVSD